MCGWKKYLTCSLWKISSFFNGHIAADEESFMYGGDGEVREPDYVSSAHEDRYYVVNPHKYMKIISS